MGADYAVADELGNLAFWLLMVSAVSILVVGAGFWLGGKIREQRDNERERRRRLTEALEKTLPGLRIVSMHWRPGWREGGFVRAWVPVAGKGGEKVQCRLDYVRRDQKLQWRKGLPSFRTDCDMSQKPRFVKTFGRGKRLYRKLKRSGRSWFAESDQSIDNAPSDWF